MGRLPPSYFETYVRLLDLLKFLIKDFLENTDKDNVTKGDNMSIEICQKCALHIDTDYDTETIVYQNDTAVCLECAVPQCYEVSIRDLTASYRNTWKTSYIEALTLDEALEKVSEVYQIENPEENLKVTHASKWSTFETFMKYD